MSPSSLKQSAFKLAAEDAKIDVKEVDGLFTAPSLAAPQFMDAHYLGRFYSEL